MVCDAYLPDETGAYYVFTVNKRSLFIVSTEMFGLEAVGSYNYQQEAQQNDEHETHVVPPVEDQKQASLRLISELIQSTASESHIKAMRMLLAMMSKGHDVVDFCPFAVQMAASSDATTRQLAYVYLNHYAEQAPNVVTLSINTFQKALTDTDPVVRILSIKTLSSIKLRENLQIIQEAVEKTVGDPYPYVRKAAAFAMIKACEVEPNEIETYIPYIERLLEDTDPIAFSGAITAYWSLCPDNIDLLHPHFRRMCRDITKFDVYGQLFILRSLTVYARYCFRNPEVEEETDDPASFWDESPLSDSLTGDHMLLIMAAKKLLNSPDAGVVMAAVSLLFYCSPPQHITAVAKPLIRLLHSDGICSEIALNTILTIATVYPHVFVSHMSHMCIRKRDSSTVKQLKLKILCSLASYSNTENILNELSVYACSNDTSFGVTAVKMIGKIALSNDSIIPDCLSSLLNLMGKVEGKILSQVVQILSHILRKRRGTDDEAQALRHLCRKFVLLSDSPAKASVLSIVGDMHETHPEFGPQLVRHIAQTFELQTSEVKLQTLTLASKLVAIGTESQVPLYLLKRSTKDSDFDVRDRARLLVAVLEADNPVLRSKLKDLLFPPRSDSSVPLPLDEADEQFQIGTFSHLFSRALGGYEPLPEWADESEIPSDDVRDPVVRMADGTIVKQSETDDIDDETVEDFFGGDDAEEEEEEEAFDELTEYSEAVDEQNIEYYEYEEEEDQDLDDFFA